MKMPKEKHKHKLTHILKFAIFSIIILAPFFAILSKMIYVSCNKNAKDSYYGETINEIQYEQITTSTELNINDIYTFNIDKNSVPDFSGGTSSQRIYYTIKEVEINTTQSDIASSISVAFYYTNNTLYAYFRNETAELPNMPITWGTNSSAVIRFTCTYQANSLANNNRILEKPIIYKTTYNKYSYLDNAFYYAINQIKQDDLFSWAKNSSLYGAINTMNTGLGLTNDHILSYLLTYWALMTAIYIIFDIVIFAFEKMTHFYE